VVEKDLKYAFYTSSEWEILVVEADGDVGEYVSLSLDGNNHPHFAYYADTGVSSGELRYTHY